LSKTSKEKKNTAIYGAKLHLFSKFSKIVFKVFLFIFLISLWIFISNHQVFLAVGYTRVPSNNNNNNNNNNS